jgi:hypothetical protein
VLQGEVNELDDRHESTPVCQEERGESVSRELGEQSSDMITRQVSCYLYVFEGLTCVFAFQAVSRGGVTNMTLNLRVHGSIPWRLTISTYSKQKTYI